MSRSAGFGPAYTYDNAAGVGFRQWEIRPLKHVGAEWHRRPPRPGSVGRAPTEARPGRSKKGARSFLDMIIRVVADNAAALEIGQLDDIPFRITYRVWKILVGERQPIPLQSYIVLATCLAKQHRQDEMPRPMPGGLFRFNYAVSSPFGPLNTYLKPLTSNSFDFIVHLTFAHCNTSFSEHEFLSLALLKNLGVLEILQPRRSNIQVFPRITDSIIRHWSEVPNPFPVLRVLRIWGYDFTTFRSLTYLLKFPSLVVYDVAGWRRDWDQQLYLPDPNWDWDGSRFIAELHDCMFKYFNAHYPSSIPTPLTQHHNSSETEHPILNHEVGSYGMPGAQAQKVMILKRDHIPSQPDTMVSEIDNLCHDICLHFLAYLLYCQIGRLWSDRDLASQGVSDTEKAFVTDNFRLIPPRPYISINFGSCCNHMSNRLAEMFHPTPEPSCPCEGYATLFQGHYTFIRKKNDTGKREYQPSSSHGLSGSNGPSDRSASNPRLRKKRKMFSMEDL
ncbi:hypothetical protein F5Y00DRAFT_247660 [Daldinia vernicosa]|uniref:uncharacterized protein n=1 Tax=Daldinia vernicosa TaxID=114800 RepID=UPI0020081916|nr:uncharacterized protein F5Y00DRAFT_247660 [Daldinia vernicosa]KAI0844886.1 hypothetical protein F5Y00DRAFT_247660 [Daldinia vernicosa]